MKCSGNTLIFESSQTPSKIKRELALALSTCSYQIYQSLQQDQFEISVFVSIYYKETRPNIF